jgi:serine/threonine-protein kinase
MGVVVIARHLMLNQPVAVKFLHPQAALRSDPVERFKREAQAAAALRSEHVARVYDVAELPSGDPYMVMEYLDGSPLSRVIRTRAPLPVEEAVDYILQACDAIGEAHSIGIVHRDLKPGNMFITRRPNGTPLLKVLDFGISKLVSEDSGDFEKSLTQTNMVMGSPQYASPEQLKSSKKVDKRTDIWALGVILYYMLTGRRPFEGDTMSALCFAIAVEKPPPITSLRPNVPQALDDVVSRCLEKDREKRMPDIGTLAAALRPFAPAAALPTGRYPAASTALAVEGATPYRALPGTGDIPSHPGHLSTLLSHATTEPRAATLMTRSAWTAPQPQRRPQILALQVAGAVAVVALVVAAFMALRRSRNPVEAGVVDSVLPSESAAATTTAAATAAPTPAPIPADGVIDDSFAPPPSPTLAAPPPATAGPSEAAPPVPQGAVIKSGWAIAKTALILKDRDGMTVGRVPKGEVIRVMKEAGGWSLVMHASSGGMLMGWAPTSAIAPPPPK